MPLGKGLDDVNLLDSAADMMNQNVVSRCQSLIINEKQHLIKMIKGERCTVFLMKVHAPSGLGKVEEKQQFQIIVKKDLLHPES